MVSHNVMVPDELTTEELHKIVDASLPLSGYHIHTCGLDSWFPPDVFVRSGIKVRHTQIGTSQIIEMIRE